MKLSTKQIAGIQRRLAARKKRERKQIHTPIKQYISLREIVQKFGVEQTF